ncbi:MAG TPA: polysaccharide pyruvyl transferase family protein [Gemmatimonadaceae bacterium]|jgi:Uncharacterized conserved protein
MSARVAPRGLRILVDSGDYQCSNLGDVAMLQITVTRLRELWPAASIEVITQDPDALAMHCPGTVPVPWSGRDIWLSRGTVLGGPLDRTLRRITPANAGGMEAVLRRRHPRLLETLLHGKLRLRGSDATGLGAFLESMNGADLVVLAGAGGFTDHAMKWATPVLELLELSAMRGVPTAVFSHGLGPIRDPKLRAIVKRVLPTITLLALREKLGAIPLMESLGIAHERVIVTGDDAVELAYTMRPSTPGTAIGVNLRIARSAEVDHTYVDLVRPVLREFASARRVPLLPIPIGYGRSSNDADSIRELLAGCGGDSANGAPLDTTRSVVEQVGRCRVVMTGAYHAAVFALSQGIPAVCLARSAYFTGKFRGLADQFGLGCTIVDLGSSDCAERLSEALRRSWEAADELREPLLDAATRQIEASRGAYRELVSLLGGTSGPASSELRYATRRADTMGAGIAAARYPDSGPSEATGDDE